jgi:hypothetical protein
MATALVLIGSLVTWVGANERRTSRAIVDHGRLASAVVDKVVWTEKGVVSKREYSFRAKVHFAEESGNVINTEVSLSDELGKKLRDRKLAWVLDVKYLPEKVSSARLANDSGNSGLCLGIGGVMFVLGVGLFVGLSVLRSRDFTV